MLKPSLGLSLALVAICGCDSGSKAQHSVEESCARLSACLPSGVDSFGECVYFLNTVEVGLREASFRTSNDKLTKVVYDCIRAASTCDELAGCYRPTETQLALCDSNKDDTCSGDVLLTCQRDREDVTAMDCSKAGLVCGVGKEGARCGLATCDADTTDPRCEGNTLLTCQQQGNVLTSKDCAADDKVCGTTPEGKTGCVGKVACGNLGGDARCEGTVMVDCEDGTESRHDCSRLGSNWTCEQWEEGGWTNTACRPVAHDCTIGKGETCSKGVITYCNVGQPDTFDCTSVGFSGCTTSAEAKVSCVK